MRIVEKDGFNARCEAKGISRTVSLFLMQHEPPEVGDFVMVHTGYALETMTEAEAATAWELYDEMLAAEEAMATGQPAGHA